MRRLSQCAAILRRVAPPPAEGDRMRPSAASPLRPFKCQPVLQCSHDRQTHSHPRPEHPLVFPPNFVDVTAENIGTVIGIVGATAMKPG